MGVDDPELESEDSAGQIEMYAIDDAGVVLEGAGRVVLGGGELFGGGGAAP